MLQQASMRLLPFIICKVSCCLAQSAFEYRKLFLTINLAALGSSNLKAAAKLT